MDFTDSDSEGHNEDLWLRLYNNSLRDEVKRLQLSKIAAEESYLESVCRLKRNIEILQTELARLRDSNAFLQARLDAASCVGQKDIQPLLTTGESQPAGVIGIVPAVISSVQTDVAPVKPGVTCITDVVPIKMTDVGGSRP